MSQFSVHPVPRLRGYVVNVQSDLLEELVTRVVIPLLPNFAAPKQALKTLNPRFQIQSGEFVLLTQAIVSVPNSRLRDSIGSLAAQRHSIIRAIDALLGGV